MTLRCAQVKVVPIACGGTVDRSREERARLAGEAGDYAGARDQYLALLAEYERALGRDHRDTLKARVGLGALDRGSR